jgi:hypothetical protein
MTTTQPGYIVNDKEEPAPVGSTAPGKTRAERIKDAGRKAKAMIRKFDMKNVNGFERAILLGTGTFLTVVLLQNIGPYAGFTRQMITDGIGRLPFVGGIFRQPTIASALGLLVGASLFVAIQSAEVLPKIMKSAGSAQYQMVQGLSGAAYILDVIACFVFWPPLSVSWGMFFMAPTMGAINWYNLSVILITVFGASAWVSLFIKFARD